MKSVNVCGDGVLFEEKELVDDGSVPVVENAFDEFRPVGRVREFEL